MKEIITNEYNLNIARYISAAPSEKEIDLATVNFTLVDIERKIAEATEKHNAFMIELGLPPLP